MIFLLPFMLIIIIIGIAAAVCMLIAYWRIYEKAGEPGWKALIPFYSTYVDYRICWKPIVFFVSLILSGILEYGNRFEGKLPPFLLLFCGILLIVIRILHDLRLSKAFGHGIPFALGLFFLPPVFLMILGFGESEYYGNDEAWI